MTDTSAGAAYPVAHRNPSRWPLEKAPDYRLEIQGGPAVLRHNRTLISSHTNPESSQAEKALSSVVQSRTEPDRHVQMRVQASDLGDQKWSKTFWTRCLGVPESQKQLFWD